MSGTGRGTAPHHPGIVPGERAGRGMAKVFPGQLLTLETVCQKLSGLVRSTRGFRVSCNRQIPPRVEKADGHVASRDWPQGGGYPARHDGRAWPGFSRLFAPSRWSGHPGARLGLAFPPPRDSRGAVGRPGVSAKMLRPRAYDRFASDLRLLPGRPDRGGLSAVLLIGRDCALAPVTWPQWHRDRVRGLGPLHHPRGERDATRSRPGLFRGSRPGQVNGRLGL